MTAEIIYRIDFSKSRDNGSLTSAEVILLPTFRVDRFSDDVQLSTGVHVLGTPSLHESSLNKFNGSIDSNHRDDGMIYYVSPPPMWSDDNLPSDSEPTPA